MGQPSKQVKQLLLRMVLGVIGLISCQPSPTGLATITPDTATSPAPLSPLEVEPSHSPIIASPLPQSLPSTARWILFHSEVYFYLINTDEGSSAYYQGFDPSWSSNGRQIVFSDRKNIHVMYADGSGLTAITNFNKSDNESVCFYPHWSPNGKRIAFWSSEGAYYALYVINADGSDLRHLTNIGLAGMGYKGPIWSPDSQQIVYSRTVPHERRPSSIFTIDVESEVERRLTDRGDEYCLEACPNDSDPIWAPNGQQIIFTSTRDGNDEIYLASSDGTYEVRLTKDPAYDSEMTWSPDGLRIAFVSERDGNGEIYVMNADGSDQKRLANNTVDDILPVWSPQLEGN